MITVWIGHGNGQMPQDAAGDATGGLLVQFDDRKLGGLVDRHQQVKLSLPGPHLGQIDMEVTDRVP